jgi:hypothetical protein
MGRTAELPPTILLFGDACVLTHFNKACNAMHHTPFRLLLTGQPA